jgi:phosphomannomutase
MDKNKQEFINMLNTFGIFYYPKVEQSIKDIVGEEPDYMVLNKILKMHMSTLAYYANNDKPSNYILSVIKSVIKDTYTYSKKIFMSEDHSIIYKTDDINLFTELGKMHIIPFNCNSHGYFSYKTTPEFIYALDKLGKKPAESWEEILKGPHRVIAIADLS